MTTRLFATRLFATPLALLAALTLLTTAACDKNKGETKDPEPVTNPDPEPEEPAEPVIPPQDPDPAEIAQLWDLYLKGDYAGVASQAATLRGSWTADTQIRASGLAAALQALAAAHELPENAKEPAEAAQAAGTKLADADLQQLAAIAQAAYLTAVQDAANAQPLVANINEGPYVGVAKIVLAESILNQAFGTGEDDSKIVAPEKLDEAKVVYEAATADASPLIQARAHFGLAAIEKYKGNKKGVCAPAQQAKDLFAAGGAIEDLASQPQDFGAEMKCKIK